MSSNDPDQMPTVPERYFKESIINFEDYVAYRNE